MPSLIPVVVPIVVRQTPIGGAITNPLARANRRLRRLWLWDLLERIELPISRILGRRRAFVYALTAQGAAFVAAGFGAPAATLVSPRLDRRDACFSAHDQRLASLWAQMKATTQAVSLRACRCSGTSLTVPPGVMDQAMTRGIGRQLLRCCLQARMRLRWLEQRYQPSWWGPIDSSQSSPATE